MLPSPVEPLGQAEVAAYVCNIDKEQTRVVHNEFVKMLGSYNHKAYAKDRRRRRRLNSIDFLEQEQDSLDPVIGLFKTLHLLECDRQTVKKRLKMVPLKEPRMSRLIILAFHFQRRRGMNHPGLVSYVEAVQQELHHFTRKHERLEAKPLESATL